MKNKFFYSTIIAVLSCLLLTFASAQSKAYRIQAISEPIQVDGQENDWQGINFSSHEKLNLDYALASDNAHLYLILVFKNPQELSTAEQTGIQLFFSQAGKKNKDIGFHFIRKIVSAEEAIARLESYGQVLTEEQKNQIREKKMFTFYEGEPVGKKFKQDLKKSEGQKFEPAIFRYKITGQRRMAAAAAPGQQSNFKAVFEFRIPIKPAQNLQPLLEPGKPVNFGLEWGGLTDEMKADIMARRAAAATRATGMDSEMVVSGEDPREGGFDRGAGDIGLKNLPKKYNFWFEAVY